MKFNFEGGKKKLLTTLGLVTVAAPAIAQGPSIEESADKEFASNKNKIEYVKKGGNDNIGGERKVKEVPQGYVKDRTEGNKTYYKKTIDGKKLELAKPGDGKESPSYTKWLIDMLKSGTASPEELVKMKYISPEAAKEYQKYYQPPTVDVVYTETENIKEADPFAAFSKMGERLFGPDRHAIADMYTAVRDTKSITDAGMLNTGDPRQYVLLRFIDGNTGKATGKILMLEASRIQEFFGTTTTAKSTEAFNKLMSEADQFTNSYNKSKTTYTYSPEALAKGAASDTDDLADLTVNKK